jgi:hypothetical protein
MRPTPTPRQLLALLALFVALGAPGGCKEAAPEKRNLVTESGVQPLAAGADPVAEAGGAALAATFRDKVRLIGVKAPAKSEVVGEPKVFVHGHAPDSAINLVGADHKPVGGKAPPGEWQRGDVLVDRFSIRVPQPFPAAELVLHVGLYEGKDRWPVEVGDHDGTHRVEAARIPVAGGKPVELPTYEAKARKGELKIDGVLDEAEWASAERAGPFIAWDGKRKIRNSTWVRVLWDAQNVYVAFECDDKDIHTPYTKRDDPLYNSEAVEMFIDADGDKDVYVELQAAPNDLHFDAAFKGGPRKNFETAYDAEYETKAKLDGTFNDNSDEDKGWVSEWRIPVDQLRDIHKTPAAGVEWKVNFFRLDRIRRGDKVVKNEASAWSTPLSGDFHNLDRFGTLRFVD